MKRLILSLLCLLGFALPALAQQRCVNGNCTATYAHQHVATAPAPAPQKQILMGSDGVPRWGWMENGYIRFWPAEQTAEHLSTATTGATSRPAVGAVAQNYGLDLPSFRAVQAHENITTNDTNFNPYTATVEDAEHRTPQIQPRSQPDLLPIVLIVAAIAFCLYIAKKRK